MPSHCQAAALQLSTAVFRAANADEATVISSLLLGWPWAALAQCLEGLAHCCIIKLTGSADKDACKVAVAVVDGGDEAQHGTAQQGTARHSRHGSATDPIWCE